jgi:glucose-1-phosphatase
MSSMQKIKNIIFDLGGVILNIDIARTRDALVKLGIGQIPELFGHGHAASFILDYEIGKISDDEFTEQLKAAAAPNVTKQEILSAWNIMLLDFPPDRIALLHDLKKRYRLFLFSNTNALHVKELKQRYRDHFDNNELDDHFEKAYYSQLLGMRKPDVSAYQYIMNQSYLRGEETLFIDDAMVNIKGANAAGLRGYFLAPDKTILDIDFS